MFAFAASAKSLLDPTGKAGKAKTKVGEGMAGDGRPATARARPATARAKSVKGKAGNFQGTGGKAKAAVWVILAPWIFFCGSWAPTETIVQ